MRKLFFTLILVLFLAAEGLQAQRHTTSFDIVWESTATTAVQPYDMEAMRVGSVTNNDVMPYYTMQIDLQTNETLDSLKLEHMMWETVQLDDAFAQAIEARMAEGNMQPRFVIKNGLKHRYALVYFPVLDNNVLPQCYNRLMNGQLSYVKTKMRKMAEEAPVFDKDSFFAKTSAFASGDWYQMRISNSGVYKITASQLSAMGIDLSNTPSNQIKVYGFGGMVDEKNSGLHYKDIPQVHTQLHDGGDGKIDAGDYILFYGQGPNTWRYDNTYKIFMRNNNPYTVYSYYYVRVSPDAYTPMQTLSSSASHTKEVDTYTDYFSIEEDKVNLGRFGRVWFGDTFDFTSLRNYSFNVSNLVPNSLIAFNVAMAASSTVLSKYTVAYNGKTRDVGFLTHSNYEAGALGLLRWKTLLASTNASIPFSIEYNHPTSNSSAWLDYVEINVRRYLKYTKEQMSFRNISTVGAGQVTRFNMQDASAGAQMQVWEVSDVTQPQLVSLQTASAQNKHFTLPTATLREFVAFDINNTYSATFVAKVPNQNLHAEYNHDYLIISHHNFMEQANELAEYHRQHSGLDVFVVDVRDIYHEYSSGRVDVAGIRDFIRSQYYNSDGNKQPKYVLLFGDASYDYKNIKAELSNFVPSYHDERYDKCLNIGNCLVTDDFYGYLDQDEGVGHTGLHAVDIAIGRFPVSTVAQAKLMLEKVKQYNSWDAASRSNWRNVITLACDDEQDNTHFGRAERHAITIASVNNNINVDKIYLGSYKQISTSAGQRAPMMNEAINNRMKKGTLIFGYSGHGGETGLADERVMDLPDIKNWDNWEKMFVMLTATCEFSRFDDDTRVSAGEYALLNSKGGAIALFTTTRPTAGPSNEALSRLFYLNALKKKDGKNPSFGDIFYAIKQSGGYGNTEKFVLFGDPALRLGLPKYKIATTSVFNNTTGHSDSLQAFAHMTVKGKVVDNSGAPMTDFNGQVFPTIFDKPSSKILLATASGAPQTNYKLQNSALYKGNVEVKNGVFSFDFVVPKDIVYAEGKGKISYYATNGSTDAAGYDDAVTVGGYVNDYVQDNQGPKIRLFINDTSFVGGGIANENPVLLAEVSDENGINITGAGIGHEVTAVLDNNGSSPRILDDYYVPKINSYKSGYITYPFYKLSDGEHTIDFKVWDIYNNSSTASISFVVVSSSSVSIQELFNYPNPVEGETTFSFQHNQSDEDLNVHIAVYNMQGQLVNELTDKVQAGGFRSKDIKWDVTDAQGNALAKGMYVYRLTISTKKGKTAEKSAKLVVVK